MMSSCAPEAIPHLAFKPTSPHSRSSSMGASPSEILSQPLFALPQPVAAINQIFCNPSPVTLHLKENYGDDFTIREAYTGQLYFRIDGAAFSLSERKVLLDVNGYPIVHMRNEVFSFRPVFNIFADRDSRQLLFRIKAKATTFETYLECKFRNIVNGYECKLGIHGDYRARAAVIYLDQGNGQPLPVARVYRPTMTDRNIYLNKQDYFLDIAPNVDMALMVLICVTLDETQND